MFPNLELSNEWEFRLPLGWVAILHNNIKKVSLLPAEISNYSDVLKVMMVGR
ncbi:MAG: hypothetical protein IPH77_06250 [Ignavibacteria bacterium]|nr:hypothetical protein [Ignavibacteria bacterium]